MPPLRHNQFIHTGLAGTGDLATTANLHGGNLPHRYSRFQPYITRLPCQKSTPNEIPHIPITLLEKIKNTQEAATNISSQKKDASRLRDFLSFCEGLGISPCDALPAAEDILLAWASSYAGRIAGKTVSAKISAIRKEHDRRGLRWYGGERLRRVIKGVEELRPLSSFRSRRAPVTISMLEDLNRGFDKSSGLDICIRAISLLSFFCQLRSGEILPPTKNIIKFNPLRHATFANIAHTTANNGSCNLHLPWSKTQKTRGDDVWIPRQEAPLDPIHAIHKHFIKNKLNLNHPIAAYRDIHGTLLTLTRSTFVKRINEILKHTDKNHPRISGHCFRIGGTTFYLVSGVPPDIVKKFGRWRSQAFLEYWRCLDYLGAIHIEMLPLKRLAHQDHSRSSLRA
jgi:hypothetical protein